MPRGPFSPISPLVLRGAGVLPSNDTTYTKVLGTRDGSQIVSRHLMQGESINLASLSSSTQTLIITTGSLSAVVNGNRISLSSSDIIVLPRNSECSLSNRSNAEAGMLCIYSTPALQEDFTQDREIEQTER